MIRLAASLSLVLLLVACGPPGERFLAPPMPVAPAPPLLPVPPAARTPVVIAEHRGTVVSGVRDRYVYDVTAPSDGVLVAQLSWEGTSSLDPTWLRLRLGDRWVPAHDGGVRLNPVVGRRTMSAGETCRVQVELVSDGVRASFLLTLSLE